MRAMHYPPHGRRSVLVPRIGGSANAMMGRVTGMGNVATEDQLARSISRYAARLHRVVEEEHHVASPLGAWLVLALCAPLAKGQTRVELTDILGTEPEQAFRLASQLLEDPHPFVASGAAVWNRPFVETVRLGAWKTTLPTVVATGDIPDQQGLDAWAGDHTLGLIKKFPIHLTPDMVFVMASALATKVSWLQPFTLVPASTLGPDSSWSREVGQVLSSSYRRRGHSQYIAKTDKAGRVAVHTASAVGGVSVTSVIADIGVPRERVLSAAHDIAIAEAIGQPVTRSSLFDLPVGDCELWTITEEHVETTAVDGREERCRAVLPAWEARSIIGLRDPALGFSTAAQAIADAMRLATYVFIAKQSALARYTRTGFEAAAVTGIGMAMSGRSTRRGLRRTAELHFGHPYASVAVTVDEYRQVGTHSQWHGLPVLSAWVAQPVEAVE
jgi:hypothetical protein